MDNEIFFKIVDEYKKRTKKECLRLELNADIPTPLSNKIGGIPYIPVGEKVPIDNGKEMALILQINLKDVDLEGWPHEGILEIFSTDLFNWPNKYAVRVFKEGLEYKKDLTIPDTESIVTRGYCFDMYHDTTYMPIGDFRFFETLADIINSIVGEGTVTEDFSSVDEWLEKFDLGLYVNKKGKTKKHTWSDYIGEEHPYLTIGGYANFTQDDIRYDGDERTECLFKIDSCYDFKRINIGDAGIMVGIISPENLKNGNFEKAEMSWDCG